MVHSSANVIILSQRGLVRELLAELLRIRCRVRVVACCATREECLPHLSTAHVLVFDVSGMPANARESMIGELDARNPQVHVVTIDDSQEQCRIEDIINAVLNSAGSRRAPHDVLTPLETEVFVAVASGHRNATIARHMRRSYKTVEKHRANAIRKLGLRGVAQLTAYAIRHGLLEIDAILARRET